MKKNTIFISALVALIIFLNPIFVSAQTYTYTPQVVNTPTDVVATVTKYTFAPQVVDIVPQNGIVGNLITIKGTGFNTSNFVLFNNMVVAGPVVSTDGVTITFTIPNQLSKPCTLTNITTACYNGNVSLLLNNNYSITVENSNGTSDSKVFYTTSAPVNSSTGSYLYQASGSEINIDNTFNPKNISYSYVTQNLNNATSGSSSPVAYSFYAPVKQADTYGVKNTFVPMNGSSSSNSVAVSSGLLVCLDLQNDMSTSLSNSITDTTNLQSFLEFKGLLKMTAGVSKGFFGQLTKNAVMDLQKANSISGTGYVGPLTKALIKKVSCK